jgi:hypothetical protein
MPYSRVVTPNSWLWEVVGVGRRGMGITMPLFRYAAISGVKDF